MYRKSAKLISPDNMKRFISCFMAIAVILCLFPLNFIVTAEESEVIPPPTVSDGVDFELLKKDNKIYFGAYKHTTGTETDTTGGTPTIKRESDFTPILWKIAGVNNTTDPTNYELTLMSAYILDYAKISGVDSFISNLISTEAEPTSSAHFSAFEQSLLTGSTFSLIASTNLANDSNGIRKTTLKNSTTGIVYLVKGNDTTYYTVKTNGNLDTASAVDSSDTTLYGVRLTVTLTIPANKVVMLTQITSSTNDGYAAGTAASKNLKFTFVDTDKPYATNADPSSAACLELSNIKYNEHEYDEQGKLKLVGDGVDIGDSSNLNTGIEIEASKSFALKTTSTHKFSGATGGITDYSINYKIVNTANTIVSSGKAYSSPVIGENIIMIPTKISFDGNYIVHIWLQKNEKVNSHVTSDPVQFNITVIKKEATDTKNSNAPETDFVIAVDYYTEVIRLVSAETKANDVLKYEGKEYIEIGNEFDSKTISDEADDYYYNYGNNVVFMYAVKAVSNAALDKLSADKKANKLFTEKWYPIYGNTIDIAKIMPKKSVPVGDKKGYYVAIRRADDPFVVGEGYESRKTVMLRGRASESDLKKSIEYDAENEQYIFNGAKMSGNSVEVRYRFNYSTAFESATMYKSGSIPNDVVSANVKVPSELFSSGGTMYISLTPTVASGYAVETAASKEIKITIPKKGNAPSVKVDEKNKKLAGLKKGSTMQYKTRDGTWEMYTGSATSIDISASSLESTFPNIMMDSDSEDDSITIIYFRTKEVTKKSPASMAAEVKISAELTSE